jgi:alpha-beta hydrolase superfamily lysophospholipase
MSDSILSTYTANDGENLALFEWKLPDGAKPRGVVIVVHGLGEHAGRYDHVAQKLNSWGFHVRAYDQYGHGDSGGMRGTLTSDNRLLADLADVVDSTRARTRNKLPVILLGHSMGGLVVGRFVSRKVRDIDALVMSSPALDPGLNIVQKLLLSVLPKLAPDFTVGNGLNPKFLSHDADVVKRYLADPLCHDRISGRLARFIADNGPATIARAPKWKVPTLLMYAGADKLVNPAGSAAFAAAAPKDVVTTQRFDALYHELFNELDAQPVFTALQRWLDQRFPR